jgi:hypothetical protein
MPKKKSGKDFIYVSGKKYDGLMSRCYRVTSPDYKRYGARGIKVCSAWIKDINVFRLWLLDQLMQINVTVEDFVKFSSIIQLDRINPDGHYEPSNCRLTNSQTNSRNKGSQINFIESSEGDVIYVKTNSSLYVGNVDSVAKRLRESTG